MKKSSLNFSSDPLKIEYDLLCTDFTKYRRPHIYHISVAITRPVYSYRIAGLTVPCHSQENFNINLYQTVTASTATDATAISDARSSETALPVHLYR